jgi:TIR domain-containing protein
MESKKVFISYSHKDEALCNELLEHLSSYENRGLIEIWHDRAIDAGGDWKNEIEEHLNNDAIILLLISASFLASSFCRKNEMEPALARHEARTATVIPVILRECAWQVEAFGKLQAVPKNALAVESWKNRDEAFTDVAVRIYRVVSRPNP